MIRPPTDPNPAHGPQTFPGLPGFSSVWTAFGWFRTAVDEALDSCSADLQYAASLTPGKSA